MGAWGVNNFENDPAMDWVFSFRESPEQELLELTLNKPLEEDYIEADEGCEALAAAEIIAALRGNKSTDFPVEISLESIVVPDVELLTGKALRAIEAISNNDTSELAELWNESDEFEEWEKVLSDLKSRLK